jgi:hypothetical protein
MCVMDLQICSFVARRLVVVDDDRQSVVEFAENDTEITTTRMWPDRVTKRIE